MRLNFLLIFPLPIGNHGAQLKIMEGRHVTISYNYIGILPANLLYDVMNGKAA